MPDQGDRSTFACRARVEDKDGHVRTRVRVRWWDDSATTYRPPPPPPPPEASALPELPLPDHARILLDRRQRRATGGYRYQGEQELSLDNFVSVA